MNGSRVLVFESINSLSAGVAVLFSENFTPVSYEVDEILRGRILKIRAVLKMRFLFLYVYMLQLQLKIE